MNVRWRAEIIIWKYTSMKGSCIHMGKVERGEEQGTIKKLKLGKASGIDGITTEILRYGGDVTVEWMLQICNLVWKQGEVPDEWRKAIVQRKREQGLLEYLNGNKFTQCTRKGLLRGFE